MRRSAREASGAGRKRLRQIGPYCAVFGCSNYRGKMPHLSFHSFPKDPALRSKWVRRCRRGGDWDPAKHFLCSLHFETDDFVRDLKAELMNSKKRNLLKAGVVPSLSLPTCPSTRSSSEDDDDDQESAVAPSEIGFPFSTAADDSSDEDEVFIDPITEAKFVVVENTRVNEMSCLRREVQQLRTQLDAKNMEISKLETALATATEEKLKLIFSPDELKLLFNKFKGVDWS